MARSVAVIDLGKSNSKVALVDTTSAEEITVVKQEAAVDSCGLYPSLDCLAIEAFVVDSLNTLASQYSIDAITVTTHGATAALVDASGELALPVIDYEFEAIDALRSDYNLQRPSFAETGSPALPGGLNVGAQLYWQQTNYPDQFADVQCVLTWPQYWVFRLSGQRLNDVTSLGCHTDLYEPHQNRYSSLIDRMGWQSIMPATTYSGQPCGTLTATLAERIKLPETTPVYTGIHDSNASLVPHILSHDLPFSVVSTGTWFVVMTMGSDVKELDEKKDTLLNVNAKGQCVPSARFMGGRERELLKVSQSATDTALDQLLSDVASASMLMPSVVPGTGPYPETTPEWIGTPVGENTELRDCVVGLYLALMTNECLELIGAAGPTFIEGPLAHDQLYAEMLFAVSGRPVMISHAETGTSIGAAMLITAPVNSPKYSPVSVADERCKKLKRYAVRWQQQLCVHAR